MVLYMAGRIVNKRGTRSNLYLKKNTHIYMEIDWAGGLHRKALWVWMWQGRWPRLRGSCVKGQKQMDFRCLLEIELIELAGKIVKRRWGKGDRKAQSCVFLFDP